MFNITPAVFAIGSEYQIMFYQPRPAYTWIEVGGREYSDSVCGNLRSAPGMRRVTVPMTALDDARGYTLCVQNIAERASYFTKTRPVVRREYAFAPVPTDRPARAYMIGDAHGSNAGPILAAKAFGEIDFLILNGDMADSSFDKSAFVNFYEVAAALTHGEKPVVYVRGNHEDRGAAAEILPDFMPVRGGKTYYTFRLGAVWGIALDCGEDKDDSHAEYGGSTRFHEYRLAETEYIESVIENAAAEYEAAGVAHRIAIVHIPFMFRQGDPFDIEADIYTKWSALLEKIGVEAVISAHEHRFFFLRPGDEHFRLAAPCPVVIGSERGGDYFGGTGFVFGDKIDVHFTTSKGETIRKETV